MRPRNKQVNRWWNPQGESSRQCAVRQAQLHLGSPTCISEEGVLTDMETQPYSCYGLGKPALFPECLQQAAGPETMAGQEGNHSQAESLGVAHGP